MGSHAPETKAQKMSDLSMEQQKEKHDYEGELGE